MLSQSKSSGQVNKQLPPTQAKLSGHQPLGVLVSQMAQQLPAQGEPQVVSQSAEKHTSSAAQPQPVSTQVPISLGHGSSPSPQVEVVPSVQAPAVTRPALQH